MIDRMDKDFGEFTVGNKVMVSDPCYENGCKIVQVVPGTWEGYVAYNDDGRVSHLMAHHRDYFKYKQLSESNFTVITDEMGVDSGQMAICDLGHYSTDDEEYRKYCDATISEDGGGIIGDYAVVSSTGWGDGEYTLYGAYNDNDECYALWVEFISDEGEEDEEDEY